MERNNVVSVEKEKCIGCGMCCKDCPSHVISIDKGKAVIMSDQCLKCGHCIAICPKDALSISGYDNKEVKEYDKNTFDIDEDVFLNSLKFRRSIRQYKNKKVEKDILEKIIEAGRFAPTGSNKQNVRYIIIENEISFYENEALKSMRRTKLLAGIVGKFVKLPYNLDNYKLEEGLFFHYAPALIFVISEDQINASIASMNMVLMADAMGMGTLFVRLFTNIANKNKKIRKHLGLKKENIVTCLTVGYPAVHYKRTVPRKTANIEWK